MKKKTAYRLRNWREYNRSLKQRGSLTVWVSSAAIARWTSAERTGARGASMTYTDLAIETMATVQALYGLAGRQTPGFLASLFAPMSLELSVPDHSTLSRRRRALEVSVPTWERSEPRRLVVDSTGVKVLGEGEWKVRQQGWARRRTWRKLHLCVDEATREIVSALASTNAVSDGEVLPDLLADIQGEVAQVSADGAYDQRRCYDAVREGGARAAIPPRKGAKIWRRATPTAERHARDENLRRVRRVGRRQWKREAGDHRRSLAETTVARYKMIFGDRLQARAVRKQFKELLLKCALLNRMTHLGLPDSYKVTG